MQILMALPLTTLYTGAWALIVTAGAVATLRHMIGKKRAEGAPLNAEVLKAVFGVTAVFWASTIGSYLAA